MLWFLLAVPVGVGKRKRRSFSFERGSMNQLTLPTKLYILLVAVCGFAALVYLSVTAVSFYWADFFILATLVVLAEAVGVGLARDGRVSVSFSIWFAGIILLGLPGAAWVTFMSTFSLFAIRRNDPVYKYIFNAGQFILTGAISGYAYIASGGTPALLSGAIKFPQTLAPLLLCASALFLTNTTLTTFAAAFAKSIPFKNVWLMNVRPFILNALAMAVIGIILAQLYVTVGAGSLILILIPLVIARQTFQVYAKLHGVYLGTVRSLVTAIEAKDHYTKGHSERVANYAVSIARQMHMPEDVVEKLEFAALLHDVGKVGISKSILNKIERLTPDEFKEIQNHPQTGASIIKDIRFLKDSVPIVLYHHERVNGTGYLRGIKGKNIPLAAKILAVADSFDAMTSARPYRPPLDTEMAVNELLVNGGTQFDKCVVDAFLAAMELEHCLTPRKAKWIAREMVGVER